MASLIARRFLLMVSGLHDFIQHTTNNLVELPSLRRRLASRRIFHRHLPGSIGVLVGDAITQHDRTDRDIRALKPGRRLLLPLSLGLNPIEHREPDPTTGETQHVERAPERVQIGDAWLKGQKDQVGSLGRDHCRLLGTTCRVDDRQIDTSPARRIQRMGQPGRLRIDDDRAVRLASIAPFAQADLRVDVDRRRDLSRHFGGDGKERHQRGFAGSSLLPDHGDGLHWRPNYGKNLSR